MAPPMKVSLDQLDKRLVAVLAENGQASAGDLAAKLGVSGPTVRSRLKNLLHASLVKVAGLVDPFRVKGICVALVGLSLTSHKLLDEKLEQIAGLPNVNWAAVVTGRYDILVELVLPDDVGELYSFLDRDLSQVGGIGSSETFVVMKARRKWVPLPRGARVWFPES